jgi:hypothetical protein
MRIAVAIIREAAARSSLDEEDRSIEIAESLAMRLTTSSVLIGWGDVWFDCPLV